MGEAERQFSIQSGAIGSGRARMGSAWGVGNALAVFSSPKDSSSAVASGIAPSLHHVTFETRFFWHFEIEILKFGKKELAKGIPNLWFFSLYSPIMRKLVNESLSAFLSLQKLAKDHQQGGSGTSLTAGQLTNVSKQYRSVIR